MKDSQLKPVPILLDVKMAAKFCSCGTTLFRRLVLTGKTPEPVHLNSKILFSTRLLELWAVNSCPARDTEKWQKILSNIQTRGTENVNA